MERDMYLIGKLDEIGKPAWIGLMVLSFIVWWPMGLALLAFLIWSGRMGCGRHRTAGRWYRGDAERTRDERARDEGGWWPPRRERSSGNWAFDDYRTETLKRLEEEQREFHDFLDRLRHAKDKAEFDQFMAERSRPQPPTEPTQPAG
jgi:hypothetical protein